MPTEIYTIGHSNHSWDTFAPLLTDNGIELVVDTRTNPVSRFAPFANRRTLTDLLESIGIDYEFMGGPLGGKPRDRSMYDANGKPDYRKMRSTDEFADAIDQLVGMASSRRTALLCSEEDPTLCHRRLLLGPSLQIADCRLLHIRKSGEIQKNAQLPRGDRYDQQLQATLALGSQAKSR